MTISMAKVMARTSRAMNLTSSVVSIMRAPMLRSNLVLMILIFSSNVLETNGISIYRAKGRDSASFTEQVHQDGYVWPLRHSLAQLTRERQVCPSDQRVHQVFR